MADGRSGNEAIQWIGMGRAMGVAINGVIQMAIVAEILGHGRCGLLRGRCDRWFETHLGRSSERRFPFFGV